ncbi:alpha-hydroxy acid oxidase [Paraburkholderia acidisoli]|uniref:Alpha-hydroxy-acid oxidizing protein n=1 Tax=Paraburkholderia acidisoli TaxID=2571748 RepID=A0A7Z2GKT2_9BURK|nr:alpha-hydroxy acid oxidase [Paraburkholderia acidisoli]QGZ63616.1 alpha-hydroxy-acid oxidizing protein [Paraburkholderia acidisoli]
MSVTQTGLSDPPLNPPSVKVPSQALKKPSILNDVYCLDDFQPLAQKKLPRQLYSYIANGADDEYSMSLNRAAFNQFTFTPRILEGVAGRSQSITLFGQPYSSPFGVSPVGLAAMWCYRGDIVLARTAEECGVPAVMSGASLIRMEDVAAAAPNTWFQAYMPGDEKRIGELLARIADAGFRTLVVTVDLPVQVNPERYAKNGFSTPLRPSARLAFDGLSHPQWLIGTFLKTLAFHGMPHFENWRAERGAPILSGSVKRDMVARDHLSWEHFKIVRRYWQGTLVLKGVMRPEDAVIARNCGVDGIIVSNHGGRQMDGAASPMDVLRAVVDAVPDVTVMMDSGIRRGTDVLKALAEGAKCVFNGRSFNYAATAAGAAGVRHAISILRTEVDRDMALLGINKVNEIDASLIRRRAA